MMEHEKTEELMNVLREEKNIYSYIKRYEQDFPNITFSELVELYIQKYSLKKSQVILKAGLYRTYAYQVLSGVKKPSRDNALRFAFGLSLNLDETQRLLKTVNYNPLYPKNRRDTIIIFCICNGHSIDESNDLLYENNEDPID